MRYYMYLVCPLLLLFVSCLLSTQTVVAAKKKKKRKTKPYQYDTKNYVSICPGHTVQGKAGHHTLQFLLQTTGATTLKNKESAQHKAACWILTKDRKRAKGKTRLPQRYALAVLYYMTQGDTMWNEKTGWLSPQKSECSWMGIHCNVWGTITGIDLGFNNLTGLFPRELKLLTKLKDVDLHGNEIQGVLPNSVLEAWKGVVYLRLHMNGLFGQLPREIGDMTSLRELHLFGNYFQGSIPTELAKLHKLGKHYVLVVALSMGIVVVVVLLVVVRTQDLFPRHSHYTITRSKIPQRLSTCTPTTSQEPSQRYLETSRTCVSLSYLVW